MWKLYFQLPRPVYILCLGTFINRAGSFFIVFLTLYLSDKLGFGTTFATRCMGVFGLGAIAASLIGGHLADQIGRRTVMLISLFGGAIILAAFGYFQSKATIMAAILVFALLIDMYRPAAAAMIGDLVRAEQRPHAFGLMYVSINLGFTFGALIGGRLATFSFLWLFWGDALTTCVYALIILLLIKETLPRLAPPVDDPSASDPDQHDAPKPVPLIEAAVRIVRDWPFMLFCLGCLLIGLVFMQGFSTLPLYLRSRGFGPDDYGDIVAVNGVLIVFCQLPLTAMLSRFNRLIVILLGGLVVGVGFGATGLAVAGWHFVMTVVVWTLGEMMQAPFTSAVVTDLAPVELRARYMGVFSMCFSSALMLGAPLGGEVLDSLGPNVLWFGCAGVAALAAVLYLAAYRSIKARHGASAVTSS